MLTGFALRFFGSYFRARRNKFSKASAALSGADMRMSVDTWLSLIIVYALMSTLFFVPIFVLAWLVFTGQLPILGAFESFAEAPATAILRLLRELLILMVSIVIPFAGSLFLLYRYPWVKIWERKRTIEGKLPYAISWMSSLASVGVIPYEIFRKLSEAEDYYGEVSKEATRLVRDVEVFGFDFMTALRNLAVSTPSLRFRTFLQGAITSSLSGGEMGPYFIAKAKENMEENRRMFSDYVQTLGMLAEIYITALVAGPLFIIVMFAAMMMMSGASPTMMRIVIYAAIPLGSLMFILLADSMTPEGIK